MNSVCESEDMGNRTAKKQESDLLLTLSSYRKLVDTELEKLLRRYGKYDMYKHMAYFMGFLDEKLGKSKSLRGKRFRPSLTLLLSEYLGSAEKALPAALSIELFHNFTLIHDDIVDNDELRRGRPTVWKLWGKDHAINTGDAQHVLSNIVLGEGFAHDPEVGLRLQLFLNEQYLEIAEGQHLDFLLTDAKLGDSIVTKKTYMTMIRKKAAVLVGAATAAAGISHRATQVNEKLLYEYGVHLGMAYQLYDDITSIWEDMKVTGKKKLGDIAERKKTLPILLASERLGLEDRKEFFSLYNQTTKLSTKAQKRIIELLEKAGVYELAQKEMNRHIRKAEVVLEQLPFSQIQKEQLHSFKHNLLHS